LPSLAGRECRVEPLSGGLTNSNYKVTTADGQYVVRVASATGGLLAIDRVNEYENSLAAAEVGVGAPVIDYLPDPCVLVVGFIDGVTLSAEDLRRGDRLGRVAAACRQLHSARRFRDDFNMFATQAGYIGLVQERGFRLPQGYWTTRPRSSGCGRRWEPTPSRPSPATTTSWRRTSSTTVSDSG
jgi:hypothetical protein